MIDPAIWYSTLAGTLDGKYTDRYLSAGARVVAVEPQATRAAMLAGIRRVRCGGGTKGRWGAAGDGHAVHDGPALAGDNGPGEVGRGAFFSGYVWNTSQPVEVVTLDNLIAEYGLPAFTKIDVEGHETDVLRGLTQPLPWLQLRVYCEYPEDVRMCAQLLLALGRYEFAIGYGEHGAGRVSGPRYTWLNCRPTNSPNCGVIFMRGRHMGKVRFGIPQDLALKLRDVYGLKNVHRNRHV